MKNSNFENISNSALRETVSLDGIWAFRFNEEMETSIAVPAPWESCFPALINRAGTAVYTTKFQLEQSLAGKSITLNFGAVDYYAEIWLDDQFVGSHEGGYTPFHFDIQGFLAQSADAEHKLIVKVTDSTLKENAILPSGEELLFADIPHGKQSWYSSVGGIWQSVWIEIKPCYSIDHIEISTDIDRFIAAFSIKLIGRESVQNTPNSSIRLQVNIYQDDNLVLASNSAAVGSDTGPEIVVVSVPDVKLWSPDFPFLYRAEVQLLVDSQVIDIQIRKFGFRQVTCQDGRVCVNGNPIFLRGVLDQDFYPKTIYTTPSSEYLREQFVKAKELGLNLMRCHIKVPDTEYLNMCDEIGLLVWYEIPNGGKFSAKYKDCSEDTLKAMWHRDSHHPCIIAVSIINEAWGIDMLEEEHRAWLKNAYHRAKTIADGWLIIDNSPCHPNFHIVSDLDDYHVYYNIPDHAGKFAEWMHNFTSKRYSTYSPFGDAEYKDSEPLIVSEFGNWGLPNYDNILDAEGGEPYWLDTGDIPMHPRGFLERFEEQQLSRAFKDYNALTDASQEQEWLSLKWEVEEMRLHAAISGYVITEFTDINWECNGLLDIGRNKKVFHERSRLLQAQDILIPRLKDRTCFWGGETAVLRLTFSTFSGRPLHSARIDWNIEEIPGLKGSLDLTDIDINPAGEYGNFELPAIQVDLPENSSARKYQIKIELAAADEALIASTTQNIVIVPRRFQSVPLPSVLSSNSMREVTPQPLMATEWNVSSEEFVLSGGNLLLFLGNGEELPAENILGLTLHNRDENAWWGDWCTTKTWFAEDAFPSLPDRSRFDFEYEAVVPEFVFTGAAAANVVSGLYAGWLHNPAGIAAKMKLGLGRVVVTTYKLPGNIGSNPIATLLLNDLIALLESP